MKKLLAMLTATALALGVTASAASAHPTPEPDCEGETYAVVSAPGDAAMAELIASWQVLDTPCIVAPGDAKTSVSASQQTVVLGGTAAVPESAVDGLNVIVRLAGADRVATAEAVLAWIDERENGATIARTEAKDGDTRVGRIESSKATFTVGKDIQAGWWYFTDNSGILTEEDAPASDWSHVWGAAGVGCLAPNNQAEQHGEYWGGAFTVNEVGTGSDPFESLGTWTVAVFGFGSSTEYRAPSYRTYGWFLYDGMTVSLRAADFAGGVCEIARLK